MNVIEYAMLCVRRKYVIMPILSRTNLTTLNIYQLSYSPVPQSKNEVYALLRLVTECLLMLVGSVMFGATFNLLTRVGLP